MALKTNFKDYILNGFRRFRIINNQNSTVVVEDSIIEDITDYSQLGDKVTASDINTTNKAVNDLNSSTLITVPATWTLTSGYYTKTVSISGMTSDYEPRYGLDCSDTNVADTIKERQKAFATIFRATTGDNTIQFRAREQISIPLNIRLHGVKL